MRVLLLLFALSLGNVAKAKALDEVFVTCRKLGPWSRSADSDYCSCLKGNLGYIAQKRKDFNVLQVQSYVRKLHLAKLGKASRKVAGIEHAETRGLFEAVSQVCEKNPQFRKPQTFIGSKTNSAKTSVPMFVPL